MTLELHVDADRWHAHLDRVAAELRGNTDDLVPVIKGNGYGLGRGVLIAEAVRLGCTRIAVGTYAEVPQALAEFPGDVVVLSPYRPFLSDVVFDPRVVHTLGRVDDIRALAASAPGTRVLLEGETTMSRHGLDRHELADAVAAMRGLELDGFAIHLPLEGNNLAEADRWAAVLAASQVESTILSVSHLTRPELSKLAAARPGLRFRPRVGTSLWLGDLPAFDVRATVLDVHEVVRGERIGYRQNPVPRDGHLLVISGGTSHGIGLEAPRAPGGAVDRAKSLAKGSLAAAGLALSPFTVAGKQRWFAEPPHMQASMVLLPAPAEPPAVGDTVSVAVRYTTTYFDHVVLA